MTRGKKEVKKELKDTLKDLDKMDWDDIMNFGWRLVDIGLTNSKSESSSCTIYNEKMTKIHMEGLAVRHEK